MNRLKHLIYFFYYLKQTPFTKFRMFLNFSARASGRSRIYIFIDAVLSTFRYNISLMDYFYFRFFSLNHQERSQWAGTGFMYEYQLRMNPFGAREVLIDKRLFIKHFSSYIKRKSASIEDVKTNPELAEIILGNTSGRIVLKFSRGQAGAEVEMISSEGLSCQKLIEKMESKGFDLVEEYAIQHPALMELSPSGLNTVRIITQLNQGKVVFLGARLRISVNSVVDNMAAGNIAAPVDLVTGKVIGPGVYSDITKNDETVHPVTGVKIIGFQIPFWKEVCQMAENAALFDTRNRSVGWDIAITLNGPELIEGNHNWCKLLWQLPVKKGLKHELEDFI